MADMININGQKYAVDKLPQPVLDCITLIQRAESNRRTIVADMKIADAALRGLSADLERMIESVDPEPIPEIKTEGG